MSRRAHRKPRTKNTTVRRTLAGLGFTAAVATGLTVTAATANADTAWGAPDTTADPVAVDTDTTVDGGTDVTPFDTGWG